MNEKGIYESITEEGLLKSLGPFRLMTSDNSISGIVEYLERSAAPNIKLSVHILPFLQIRLTYNLSGDKEVEQKEKKEMPIYEEPRTTGIKEIEIIY